MRPENTRSGDGQNFSEQERVMARFWQQICKGERGQALPIVLVLLVLGGLLITPTLSYATTSLNAVQITKQNVKGIYAADAGVEHVLWCIKNSEEPPKALPYTGDPINGMEVAIVTNKEDDPYALYYGGFVKTGGHYDYLEVDHEMVWDGPADAYKYTIIVANAAGSTISLREVGARLPVGYAYVPGSADYAGNPSILEPDDELDRAGAHLLKWEFGTPRPRMQAGDPPITQTFYVTGTGEQEGDYAWTIAAETDIGTVGEFSGILYRITATATLPGDDDEDGEVTAKVMVDAIFNENTEELLILLWQTTKEQDDD